MQKKRRLREIISDEESDSDYIPQTKRRRRSTKRQISNHNNNNTNHSINNDDINKKLHYTQLFQQYITLKEAESQKKLSAQTKDVLKQKKRDKELFSGLGINNDTFCALLRNKKQQKLKRETERKHREKNQKKLLHCVDLLMSHINPEHEITNNYESSDDDNEQWIDDIPDIPQNKTVTDFEAMKVSELKQLCRSIGFQVSGKKCILIGRLLNPAKAIREKKYAHFMKHPIQGRPQYYDTKQNIIDKIIFDENKFIWKKSGIVKSKPID